VSKAKIRISEVNSMAHYRYQPMTESLYLGILRMAIVPPADRNGCVIRTV